MHKTSSSLCHNLNCFLSFCSEANSSRHDTIVPLYLALALPGIHFLLVYKYCRSYAEAVSDFRGERGELHPPIGLFLVYRLSASDSDLFPQLIPICILFLFWCKCAKSSAKAAGVARIAAT